MIINHKKTEDILTIAPEGRIDSVTSGEFEAFIDQQLTDDVRKLSLDFSGVDFISSKGLRVIVSLYKKLGEGSLEITGANTSVKEVFRLSGLMKIINIQ